MRSVLAPALLGVAVVAGACTTSGESQTSTFPVETSEATPTVAGGDTAVPAPRMGHTMVGIGDGKLLVYGGRSFQGRTEVFLQDTWVYDTVGNEWSLIAADGPLPRSQHAMAYDPDRNQVLLFGGYVGSSSTYGDTWLFDIATASWRRVEGDGGPSARAGSVLVYDESADVFVMFGGAEEPPAAELPLPETWVFDPAAEQWQLELTNQVPTLLSEGHPTLFELAMVYDREASRSILMVAGESTWVFDANAVVWAKVDHGISQGLGADYMTAAAYDPTARRTISYGGAPVERTQGTWSYDSAADRWEQIAVDSTPGPIANHAMAYDASTDTTYLFGGAGAVLVLEGVEPVANTMWALDDDGWRLVAPAE